MTGPAKVLSIEPLDDGYTQVSLKVPGIVRKVRVIVPPGKADTWSHLGVGDLLGIAARAVKDGVK